MNIRAMAVFAGTVTTAVAASFAGAIIAASPAEAPTLDQCAPQCPVVTQGNVRWQPNTDREGWRLPLKSSDR